MKTTLYSKHKNEIPRLIRFGITGCMNTGVDFIVFWILTSITGTQAFIAQGIGYTCGLINSYLLNSIWVFVVKENILGRRIGGFLAINLGCLLFTMAAMHILTNYINLYPMPAKVMVTGMGMLINYIGYKKIVFV